MYTIKVILVILRANVKCKQCEMNGVTKTYAHCVSGRTMYVCMYVCTSKEMWLSYEYWNSIHIGVYT